MTRPLLLAPLVLLLCSLPALPQPEATGPVKVEFHQARSEGAPAVAPIDPAVRIQFQHVGRMMFGLTYDQNTMLSCGPGSMRTTFRVDDRMVQPTSGPAGPLPAAPAGKRRTGGQSSYTVSNLVFTEQFEVVPSRAKPGEKRALDAVLIRYVVENKSGEAHKVGARVYMDAMVADNDGCLFAAPVTHPGKILDGVELRDKSLPPYVQVLQNPNLVNPGFVSHFNLKVSPRVIGPDRFVCTSLGAQDTGWNVAALPANGDSACALFWEPRLVPPGGKVEFGYGYGKGLAAEPEGEGRLSVALSGSFEPHKLFTIAAYVDDPLASQTLTLELPAGLELVEGKAIQPVPPPGPKSETSVVLWKGRVRQLGTHALAVRSSTGVAQLRSFTVTRAAEKN